MTAHMSFSLRNILHEVSMTYFHRASAIESTDIEPAVNKMLKVSLQSISKVVEHGRTSREHNVLSGKIKDQGQYETVLS